MAKFNELVIDTNFFIEATKRRILDNARECVPGAKLVTLEAVVNELREQNQRVALELIKAENIEVKPITGYADKSILEYAKEGVAVATNDKALTQKLRARGIAVVYPKQKGCDITGGIV